MGELVKFEKQPNNSVSIAYEYDINSGRFIWKSDISKIFAQAETDKMHSKDKYIYLVHDEDKKEYIKAVSLTLKDKTPLEVSYRLKLSDGRIMKAEDVATYVESDGRQILIGIINIRETKDYGNLPTYYNNTDFLKNIDRIIERSKQNKTLACLLKISINNLPTFISWHGADSVNRMMDQLKLEIAKFTGAESQVYRVSIDEFCAILENTTVDFIQQCVNKINYHIKNYRAQDVEEHLKLNSSIGSVYLPQNAENSADAMNKAFIAVSAAKESRKNFYVDYANAENDQLFSKEQIKVMYYMKDSVNQNKFCLAYQPIVESRTGKVTSYECLLRMRGDDGKVSTAWPVIHVAEKTGFIDIVDHFVLDRVVEELRADRNLELTFNVSNITTDSPKWLASCSKYFSDADIASRATIEITETAAERDLKQTAYFVASLQALGCKVALDDFGAGYTSFRQLKSLSVDMVKIDGMFILDLAENSENLLFIKTLLDFNNCYGLQTIAECVESGEVAKLLMDLNVDYMQGYYFGVPNIDAPWKKKQGF